jgi:hypothetical protein
MNPLSLKFERARKARIWCGDLPSCPLLEGNEFRTDLRVDKVTTDARDVAAEVAIPLGGRRLYGLLGASYIPDNSKNLRIAIPYSEDRGDLFVGALSDPVEPAYCGLTSEYAQGILEEVRQHDDTSDYAAGILRFNRGAHSLVGSTPVVFSNLSRLILLLIFNDKTNFDDTELLKRVESILERIASG